MEIKYTPRLYQETIFNTCRTKNCLVILPTGLGKTKTAILVAVHRLKLYPNSKILFLTPTKPLANQIAKEFLNSTTITQVEILTGSIPPAKRQELWNKSKVFVSTPQGCANDIINKKISLKEVSCIIFDEAHRAVGDYDYVWIAKKYVQRSQHPRIVALTASPGSDKSKIKEVCKNLFIDEIETRTPEDQDVLPYIQELKIEQIQVELPKEFEKIQNYLKACYKSKIESLKRLGLVGPQQTFASKSQLISLQATIHSKIAHGQKEIRFWQGISIAAQALKSQHALEMLETQGIDSLNKYLKTIFEAARKSKTKANKELMRDTNFKSAYTLAKRLLEKNIQHPKLIKLIELIKKEIDNKRIIIFNQYRDSALLLEKELNKIPNVNAKLFVGQLKKEGTGLTQKKQIEIIQDFEKGKYNVLVSTSIGEEGLDIPQVDIVIFYEPIPSAIRSIQRRGRTARLEKGKVIILITKNTRDEAYHWTAFNKEKRMHKILKDLKNTIVLEQKTISSYSEKKESEIIADFREKNSNVLKQLIDNNVDVTLKSLDIADYIISNKIAIERKNIQDFIHSLIDQRILIQLKQLKENFETPIIILEGTEDIYSVRNVHANSIRGLLSTIATEFKIPIIPTKNSYDTALLIKTIAEQQTKSKKDIAIRLGKKPLSLKEQQEFIVSSLPNIGSTLAKLLLRKFGSISNIINASEEELMQVEKVGIKTANEIKKVLTENYPYE